MEPIVIKPKARSVSASTSNNTSNTSSGSTPTDKPKKETPARRNLLAVSIVAGIITLLDEKGTLIYYRQRGITGIDPTVKLYLINAGFLHRNWDKFRELPSNISIRFEDEEILGKARATFPAKEAMKILGV